MKTCNKCKKEQQLDQFHTDTGSPDGKFYTCKTCRKVQDRKRYFSSNKKEIIQQRENKIKYFLYRYKKFCKCYICKEDDPVCLEFHHINPDEKEFNISCIKYFGRERLKKEIKKCKVICSNCHRKLHAYDKELSLIKLIKKARYQIKKNKPIRSISKNRRTLNGKILGQNYFKYQERKFNITKKDLQRLVWELPTTKIAEHYGVSDKAIEKRCNLFGIKKPPRGYWTKRKYGSTSGF